MPTPDLSQAIFATFIGAGFAVASAVSIAEEAAKLAGAFKRLQPASGSQRLGTPKQIALRWLRNEPPAKGLMSKKFWTRWAAACAFSMVLLAAGALIGSGAAAGIPPSFGIALACAHCLAAKALSAAACQRFRLARTPLEGPQARDSWELWIKALMAEQEGLDIEAQTAAAPGRGRQTRL